MHLIKGNTRRWWNIKGHHILRSYNHDKQAVQPTWQDDASQAGTRHFKEWSARLELNRLFYWIYLFDDNSSFRVLRISRPVRIFCENAWMNILRKVISDVQIKNKVSPPSERHDETHASLWRMPLGLTWF